MMFDPINRREALQLIDAGVSALSVLTSPTRPAPLELHEWVTEDEGFWTDQPQIVHGPLSVRDRATVICSDGHQLLQMPLEVFEAEHESSTLPTQTLLTSLAARPHLSDEYVQDAIRWLRSEWPDRWQPWPEPDYRINYNCSRPRDRSRFERLPFAAPCPICLHSPLCSNSGCHGTEAAHYRITRDTLGCGHSLYQPFDRYLIPASTDILIRRLQRSRPGHELQWQAFPLGAACSHDWPAIAFRIADLRGLVSVAGSGGYPLLQAGTEAPRPDHAAQIAAAMDQLDQVWSATP